MSLRRVLLSAVLGLLPTVSGVVVGQEIYVDSPRVEDAIGVNVHFTPGYFPKSGEMKMLAGAGFRWVRTDLRWEKTDGQRGYDFQYYDRLVEEFDRYHIHPIFILCYRNHFYEKGNAFSTDDERQAFAKWAGETVRHFQGRGIYWEIYNEPNNKNFWEPNPNPDDYVKLAIATAKAIRDVAPNETIIGPATSEIDFEFLKRCFSKGLLPYLSAVSIHPYRRTNPETVATDYRRLRTLIEQYEPKGKRTPIISGEWGYSSVWQNATEDSQGKRFNLTEETQGKFFVREMLTNLASDIHLSIWYDWSDDDWASKEDERHFGTVRNPYGENSDPVYGVKPSYLAAQTLTTVLSGYRLSKRLDVGAANDYVLLFSNGESTRLTAWTTSTVHNVTIPVKAGNVQVIGWRGATLPQQVASDRGLVITLTDAPQYFIPEANRLWPIHLNGTENWHDTGIAVKQGQIINITATGRIVWNPNPENNNTTAGPDGVPYNGYRLQQPQDFPMPEANVASLIMRIGNMQYAVGSKASIQVRESGTIQLMINDRYSGLHDNTGDLSVRVEIAPATAQINSPGSVKTLKIENGLWQFLVTITPGSWFDTGIPVIVHKSIRIRTEHKEPPSDWRIKIADYEFARNRVIEEAATFQIDEGVPNSDRYRILMQPQDSPTIWLYLRSAQSTRLEITIGDSGRCLQCIVGCPDEHKRLHEQGETKAARLVAKIGN